MPPDDSPRRETASRIPWTALFLVANLVLVWALPLIPAQDLPQHLTYIRIFADYGDPSLPVPRLLRPAAWVPALRLDLPLARVDSAALVRDDRPPAGAQRLRRSYVRRVRRARGVHPRPAHPAIARCLPESWRACSSGGRPSRWASCSTSSASRSCSSPSQRSCAAATRTRRTGSCSRRSLRRRPSRRFTSSRPARSRCSPCSTRSYGCGGPASAGASR